MKTPVVYEIDSVLVLCMYKFITNKIIVYHNLVNTIIAALFFCLPTIALATQESDLVSSKEIIEALVELKEGQKALNQRIDDLTVSVNNRFDDVNNRFDDVNDRFDDVNRRFDDVNRRFDDVNNRFDDVNGKFDDYKDSISIRFDDMNQRIDDVKDENRDIKTFLYWGFGILFGAIGLLMTIVIWDRRTAIAPVVKKVDEVEEKNKDLKMLLKEYARVEPKFAEILRTFNLL